MHDTKVKYPHAKKLLQKCVISNKAINMRSRGPTEQQFYVWKPHCGCLHKVKKVLWYPSLKRANGAINIHSRGSTLPSKWKMVSYPQPLYYFRIGLQKSDVRPGLKYQIKVVENTVMTDAKGKEGDGFDCPLRIQYEL